ARITSHTGCPSGSHSRMSGGSRNSWSRSTGRYPLAIPILYHKTANQDKDYAARQADSATTRITHPTGRWYFNGARALEHNARIMAFTLSGHRPNRVANQGFNGGTG